MHIHVKSVEFTHNKMCCIWKGKLVLALKESNFCALLRSLRSIDYLGSLKRPTIPGLSYSWNSDTANMSEKKQTVDLGLLEEDDEFEEFPAEGKL